MAAGSLGSRPSWKGPKRKDERRLCCEGGGAALLYSLAVGGMLDERALLGAAGVASVLEEEGTKCEDLDLSCSSAWRSRTISASKAWFCRLQALSSSRQCAQRSAVQEHAATATTGTTAFGMV